MPSISPKAFKTGDEFPAKEPGKLRLYSMRFCPFAERTALVLAHKKIPHEVVNINLKKKPEWFLERNPLGLVPTLEIDGKVVYESSICNDWLDIVYPEDKLNPTDPYELARQKMLMERFSKLMGSFYAVMRNMKDPDLLEALNKNMAIIESALEKDYFNGASVGILDFNFWPVFERAGLLSKGGCDFTFEKFPKIQAWIDRMLEQPAIKEVVLPADLQDKFYKTYLDQSREHPDYDIGL